MGLRYRRCLENILLIYYARLYTHCFREALFVRVH